MKGSFAAAALLAAVLCAGCSQPTSPISPTGAGLGSLSVSAQPTPFKGLLEGTATVTPLTPPMASVVITASGNATKLGQFTLQVPHLVNFATRIGIGTYTFTAANGDRLTADFTGQAEGTPPNISIVERATITGGTGRFEGATGSFTVERLFNQATGITTGSFDGVISGAGD
jgi:hypothetical protein